MPIINRHACNKCDFEMPTGWGGYTYAVNDAGKRVVCAHPGEFDDVVKVTGLGYSEAVAAGRAGNMQHYVCLDCLQQFDLDPNRDVMACSTCRSTRLKSLRKLIGQSCPKCKVGIFEESSPICWKLDPDWETLPVPEIVKDLVRYSNNHQIVPTLQKGAGVAAKINKFALYTLADHLLDWWQGEHFPSDSEPKPSLEMNPGWAWCQALQPVIDVTPALAAMIDVGEISCSLAANVDPEVWRGIKNYIRKHRVVVMES